MKSGFTVDDWNELLDGDQLVSQLCLESHVGHVAGCSARWGVIVVVVDEDSVGGAANIDLDKVDTHRDCTRVTSGGGQPLCAAFAAVCVDQRWHGGLPCPA